MSASPKLALLLVLCAGALGGCAATHPVDYRGLASASQMAPNLQDKNGHMPFRYSAADTDWTRYTSVVLDPVAVYDGPTSSSTTCPRQTARHSPATCRRNSAWR